MKGWLIIGGVVALLVGYLIFDEFYHEPYIEKNQQTGEWRVIKWGRSPVTLDTRWSVEWQGMDSLEAIRQHHKVMDDRHGTCNDPTNHD